MPGRRLGGVEVGATGVAVTALAGEWLAHTVEYARLNGVHGAFGSVHAYMGPTGLVLAAAALIGVHSTARLAGRLQARLADLRRRQSGGAGRRPPAGPRPEARSRGFGGPALLALVWATQCGLYLLQENLEAGLAHHGAPGLSVLGGAHAPVPLVQLVVALALVAALWLARRRVTHLVREVRRIEGRLPSVEGADAPVRPARSRRAWTPIDRWGTQLWSRPPPAPRVA